MNITEQLTDQTNDIVDEILHEAVSTVRQFLYQSLSADTIQQIYDALDAMLAKYHNEWKIHDDYMTEIKSMRDIYDEMTSPYDSLTAECDSYAQYRLKKAVISGEEPKMSEEEFERQRRFSRVEQCGTLIDISFRIQGDNKLQKLTIDLC